MLSKKINTNGNANIKNIGSPPRELRVHSKSQKYDSEKKIFTAKGLATAYLDGYLLKADKIQFSNDFNNIYAVGRVRLKKRDHYFQASSLRYNLIKKEGILKNVYGVVDIKSISKNKNINLQQDKYMNFEEDKTFDKQMKLKLPAYQTLNSQKINKNRLNQNVDNVRMRNSFSLNASFGGYNINSSGIRLYDKYNKYRPGRFISGEVNRWRIQADKLSVNETGWDADRINFTNDPLSPAQTRIEAFGVFAKEDSQGDFLIISKRSKIIFDEKLKLPFIKKKRIKDEEIENRWVLGIDDRDRDGLFIGYNLDELQLNDKYTLNLQPQFLIQRAFNGGTNSYTSSSDPIYFGNTYSSISQADMLGLKASIKGNDFGWDIDLNADFSSLDIKRFAHGNRYWLGLNKTIRLPFLSLANANLFGAYRYRVWNGSLGQTDIYSAYGGFLEKKGMKEILASRVAYLLRFGLGNYQSESIQGQDLASSWKANVYASLNTSYPIWKSNKKELLMAEKLRYSPSPINPGLFFNFNLDSSYSLYEDGKYQNSIGLRLGPSLTLGNFRKKAFDYTKLMITAGAKLKGGQSPFKFDEVVDLGTLSLGLTQQIYGPLLLRSEIEFNIDRSSEFYGKVINSKFEARWQRRSYDFGLYYNPRKGMGGITVRLHDFNFTGNGIPFAPEVTLK